MSVITLNNLGWGGGTTPTQDRYWLIRDYVPLTSYRGGATLNEYGVNVYLSGSTYYEYIVDVDMSGYDYLYINYNGTYPTGKYSYIFINGVQSKTIPNGNPRDGSVFIDISSINMIVPLKVTVDGGAICLGNVYLGTKDQDVIFENGQLNYSWTAYSYKIWWAGTGCSDRNISMDIYDNRLRFRNIQVVSGNGGTIISEPIDLTEYSSLDFSIYSISDSNYGCIFSIITDAGLQNDYRPVKEKNVSVAGIFSFDISSLTGEHRIVLSEYNGSTSIWNYIKFSK